MPTTGISAEKIVAEKLRNTGCTVKVRQNTKMKGKADVLAKWHTGKVWRIQVKSTTTTGQPRWPNDENLGILKMTASLNDETPVVALVNAKNNIEFYSARTKKRIYP